ncbi:MAG TPA: hypothetical protein VGZ29_03280 [Terriglobia bacterium]|nr:hypothetical protein [Terriglobia bacterium]
MSLTRRRLLSRSLEVAALALVLLDSTAYFAFLRPLKNRLLEERTRRVGVHLSLLRESKRVNTLQRYVSELPAADAEISQFLEKHIPTRTRAFSTADTLVAQVSQKSGIELTGVAYKPEIASKNPLQWLRIDMDAAGRFNNLMDFLQQLQSGDDFLLFRSFGFEVREDGKLSMHVAADLYLTP